MLCTSTKEKGFPMHFVCNACSIAELDEAMAHLERGSAVDVKGWRLSREPDNATVWVTSPYGVDVAWFELSRLALAERINAYLTLPEMDECGRLLPDLHADLAA